jgi:hypothetical protein
VSGFFGIFDALSADLEYNRIFHPWCALGTMGHRNDATQPEYDLSLLYILSFPALSLLAIAQHFSSPYFAPRRVPALLDGP